MLGIPGWICRTVAYDAALMLPLIKAAINARGSSMLGGRLFGSPWSPPAWMKTNNNMMHGGSLKPDPAIHTAWAEYFGHKQAFPWLVLASNSVGINQVPLVSSVPCGHGPRISLTSCRDYC